MTFTSLYASRSFVRSLFLVLSSVCFLYLDNVSVCAQMGVVQGVRNIVRPRGNNDAPHYDRAMVFPEFSENGAIESDSNRKPIIFTDLTAEYSVLASNVSWSSREGYQLTARVYYPASMLESRKKFAAVVYSHGLGSSPDSFSYLGYYWAGHGIVTICLRHPESDESIWRGKLRAMGELKEAYQRYWTARDRVRALRSGVDLIISGNSGMGPLSFLKECINEEAIGVAGNDLGALGSLLLAGQLPPDNGVYLKDPRISAVLALSPPVFCEAFQGPNVYGRIEAPLMVVTGTQDDGIVGSTKAYQRRIPYDSVSGVDRYLVVLQGADHRVYGGRRLGAKQGNDRIYQETIAKETADFWRAYLLRESDVLNQMCAYGKASSLSNVHIEWKLGGEGVMN